jgi:hypothetical protein
MQFCRRRIWLPLLVVTLCVLHGWMAASVSRSLSCTADEIAHLTSGYAYWTLQDYRLQPENGNFPQRWAAIPLLWMDVKLPPTQGSDWDTANIWRIGYTFFYKSGNDAADMLAAGRAMIAVLSSVLCLVTYFWTRDLFGWKAGLFSLILAAFAPELLAHGGLVTSDLPAALGFTIAVLSWWRLLHHATPGRILAAGLCVGFLAVSKHSVVLFAPIAVLMTLVRLLRPAPLRLGVGLRHYTFAGWRRIPVTAALLAGSALICVTTIWSIYGFRYRAAPPAYADRVSFVLPWANILLEDVPPHAKASKLGGETVDPLPGIVQHFVRFTRDHHILPEAWLYGLAFVEKNSRARLAYFSGEYRRTGWLEFFPVAFALKTTFPALALIITGITVLALEPRKRRIAWLYQTSPLLILLLVYWVFSLNSKLNIGHRHLLPTYPAFYILAGACLLLIRRHRVWAYVLIGILGWHVSASVITRPDYLAYFNPMAGGPYRAHRLFVDSSLDWGQDLPRLHQWLDAHAKGERVVLSYFGSGSPHDEGIDALRLGDGYFDWEPRRTPPPLTGGVYCFSATMFHRVYTLVRGPWTHDYEIRYQGIGDWLAHMAKRPKGSPPSEIDGTPMTEPAVADRLFEYEQLELGRLCHFLQLRKPDAMVGYSFLIFRLTDDEVAFALKAPLPAINAYLLNWPPQP